MPYNIAGEIFHQSYYLADGIYPKYSRFVKTITQPLKEDEKYFSAWQEAKRKDIERMFGVLKGRFRILAHPMEAFEVEKIAQTVMTCLILHNMNIEEYVSGNEKYRPENFIIDDNMIELGVQSIPDSLRLVHPSTHASGVETDEACSEI